MPSDDTVALYVKLPRAAAEKLDRAAFELKAHKRDLVAGLVERYIEVPPPERERRRRQPTPLPVPTISSASEWVSGMQREIRDYAKAQSCASPFVRVTLEDGDRLFLRTLHTGPGEDYVRLGVHPGTRTLVVHLDAIRRVDFFDRAPAKTDAEYVFRPRGAGVGFTSR